MIATPYLPPAMVCYLNALYHQGEASLELEKAFRQELDRARSWLTETTRFTLDDEDSTAAENLRYLWQALEHTVDGPHGLDQVASPLLEAAVLMEGLRRRRSLPHFSPQPPVNRLLMAGAAMVLGRGEPAAVQSARQQALSHLRLLQLLYFHHRPSWSPEVRRGLLQGFILFRRGLRGLASQGQSPERVQEDLKRVKGGSELLQNLLEWEARQPPHPLQKVPGVGLEAGPLWREGREIPESFWSDQERLWERLCPALLLPLEARQDCLRSVEEALQAGDAPALGRAWSQIDKLRWLPEALAEVPALYGQAIQGILAGATPDVCLLRLLESHPLERDIAFPCMQYLESGEGDFLHQAVQALMARHQVLDQWRCPGCGSANPMAQEYCGHCSYQASVQRLAGLGELR